MAEYHNDTRYPLLEPYKHLAKGIVLFDPFSVSMFDIIKISKR